MRLPEVPRHRLFLEEHVEAVEGALDYEQVDGHARLPQTLGVPDILGVKKIQGADADPGGWKPRQVGAPTARRVVGQPYFEML